MTLAAERPTADGSAAERSPALWPAGFRIRPSADEGASKVDVVDTVTGRRFRWTPEALAREILGTGAAQPRGDHGSWSEALSSFDDRRELVPGLRYWDANGWHPSEQYYVAARRWPYVDTDDADGSIRTETVERLLASGGPPVAERRPDGPRVALGPPAAPGPQSLSTLLVRRRTARSYRRRPVPRKTLSGLLWYGLEGIRVRRRETSAADPLSFLESYGSAWDVYLCVYDVGGVGPGTYWYDIVDHHLVGVRPGDHREAMVEVLQGMRSPASAAWTLGLVADFPRYQWRYRHEHALRRLWIEAGFVGQELLALGLAYGLGTLVTPAQRDTSYLELHGLSSDRYAPVYTLTMGLSRKQGGDQYDPRLQGEHRAIP